MRFIPIVILVLLLSACGGTAPETSAELPIVQSAAQPPATVPTAYPAPQDPSAIQATPDLAYPAPAVPVQDPYPASPSSEETMSPAAPTGQSIPLTSGAIGPLLEAVALDLSSSLSIPVEDVQFQSAESVIWPDGGLGCPDPSMMYTQVLTEGILVRVQAGDVQTEYHTDGLRRFVRCEDGQPVSEGIVPRR